MRSMLLSTALVFTALISSGCATLNCDKGCGVDAVSSCDTSCNDCCKGRRVGGLIGRLRSAGCNDCCNETGQACGNANCNSCRMGGIGGGRMGLGGSGGIVGNGMIGGGRMGSGIGAGQMGAGGIGGRGALAGGFGRMGACSQCGMTGGGCMCIGNHSPYTPEFAGPHGPETGHYRYPYYTTRAPRDFLMANPPSIGR